MTSDDPLSEKEKAAAKMVADAVLAGDETADVKLAARATAIALHRWGIDLERDAPDQQWSAYPEAVRGTVGDVLESFADSDAEIDGVDGLVFEGIVVEEDLVVEETLELTSLVEDAAHFDRHEPGPLVEPVQEVDPDQ